MARTRARRTTRGPRQTSSGRGSIEVGHRLAADVLRFRDAALKRRTVAVRRTAEAGAVQRFAAAPLVAAAGGLGRTGVLVAEGDSWFDYPWHDILRMLEDNYGYDVESVAHRGDTVESMAYTGQLEEFARAIEKVVRQGTVPAAILLSGGGNDIAGSQFQMLINHTRSPHAGLNDQIVSGVIDGRVFEAYVTILTAVTDMCRQRTGGPIRIIIHGYDHAVPDGRGVLGGWGPLPGPWLQPGLRDKGFEDPTACRTLVADLIDRFNVMLKKVAALPAFGHVRYLDLRGTLSNGATYKTWWANELHPTERGFAAVADRFASAV
jgi:GDSL-like Lipase/Acylhydrolase family